MYFLVNVGIGWWDWEINNFDILRLFNILFIELIICICLNFGCLNK